MFDKFWKDHPEIKDRDAYLKKYWEEQAKANELLMTQVISF